MSEVWKPIPKYEGIYEVSSIGNVRSVARVGSNGRKYKSKNLSPCDARVGYLKVLLRNGIDNGKNKLTHVLVAEAFIPNPEGKKLVNHKDGNKANNSVDNLEWCTPLENIRHSLYVLGNAKYGSKHHAAVMNEDIVRKIKETYRDNPNFNRRELGRLLGVSDSNIYTIISGNAWKHVKI